MIKVKRVYEPVSADDGLRVLVDRLWPRGLSKEKAKIDHWLKDLAPSDALRKWFAHDPARWKEFRRRYALELRARKDLALSWRALQERDVVTLLFAAKDERRNNAVVLKSVVAGKMKAAKNRA